MKFNMFGIFKNTEKNRTSLDTGEAIAVFDKQIRKWHHDRNLISGSTDKDQVLKLIQGVGELSDNCCKGKDMRDDLGDIMVVMINIMERNNYTLDGCLAQAYGDIKDRKGRMVDGIFVKEGDL